MNTLSPGLGVYFDFRSPLWLGASARGRSKSRSCPPRPASPTPPDWPPRALNSAPTKRGRTSSAFSVRFQSADERKRYVSCPQPWRETLLWVESGPWAGTFGRKLHKPAWPCWGDGGPQVARGRPQSAQGAAPRAACIPAQAPGQRPRTQGDVTNLSLWSPSAHKATAPGPRPPAGSVQGVPQTARVPSF